MKRFVLLLLSVLLLAGFTFSVTTIEFWHAMSGDRMRIIEEMVKDFEALHPNIKVNAQFTGSYDDTLNKLISSSKVGMAPHIVQIYEIGTRLMIDSGLIIPAQDMLEKDESYDVGILVEPVINYYTVDGKLYSMPFNSSSCMLYYNKTLFEKAGLDPNKPPQTYEEVIEYSRILTKKDASGKTIQYGLTWANFGWYFEQLLAKANAPYVDNNNGRTGRATKAVFNNDAGVKIFEFLHQLNKEGLILNTGRANREQAAQNFVSGAAAMLMESTANLEGYKARMESNGYEIGTAFLPVPNKSVSGGSIIGGASLWLMKGHSDEETKAAWEFMKYLSSEEVQIKWHKATGYTLVRKDAIERLHYERWFAQNPDNFTAQLQLLVAPKNYNTAGAVIGVFPEARTIIETAYERMVAGELTAEKTLEWAEKEVTKLIENYNKFYK